MVRRTPPRCLLLTAALAAALADHVVLAQDGRSNRDRPNPERPFANLPFAPDARDRGPLRPGEEEAFMALAQDELPTLFGALSNMRAQRPPEFQRRLSQLAPHFRFLQRAFAEDPKRGELLAEHLRNGFIFERTRRALRDLDNRVAGAASRPDSGKPPERPAAVRQRMEEVVRRAVARNIRIEAMLLESRAAELERTRDERVGERVTALLRDDADLSLESGDVRRLVEQSRREAGNPDGSAFETSLQQVLSQQIDMEIDGLRAKVARLRAGAREEQERRVGEILGPGEARRP